MRAPSFVMLIILLLGSMPLTRASEPAVAPKPPVNDTTAAEAELGKKTAEQIEAEFKLVKDEVAITRLTTIVNDIIPHTDRPGVIYTLKILDTGALNAMAIPGGTVYVTKGLLNAVESDHELAGVLAHEIAHNAMRHAKKLTAKDGIISSAQFLTILLAIYANKGGELGPGQVIAASQMVKQALLNGYTVDLEIEADDKALTYLAATKKYDPNGLYSVILGFRQIEHRHPFVEMGMFKTHPYSEDRKRLIEEKLKELGVKLNIWNVVKFRADAQPVNDGKEGYALRLGGTNLFTVTRAGEAESVKARAEDAAASINRRLSKDYIQQFDIARDVTAGVATVRMRWMPVFTLTQADADAAGTTLEALSALVTQRLKSAIADELIKRT